MDGALKTIFMKNPGIPPHEMLVNVEARAIRALEMASDRYVMDEEIKSTERRLRQLKHYRAITSDGSLVRAVERVHEKIATQIEEGTVPGDVMDQANMMQCLEKSRRQLADIKERLMDDSHGTTVSSDGGDKADEDPKKTWIQLLEEGL
ncbi:hypothetical protein TI39_contig602g00002 [Zymoseptoria brevis]|uniref:Uncharacterized protein n=1 Tax=Zymoseptoria brevis TaxID=1047168 RepID=A0A0F4GI53_9PEZI|nr:hypothetical protein TI39_contig602g00002 [Zymoseptoria brevis]